MHNLIPILLKQRRKEFYKENYTEFAKRLFPNRKPKSAANYYRQIENGRVDFPAAKLPEAAIVLDIPLEKLETY